MDRQLYQGREQSLAKHFILKRYLQALAFKVLRHWDLTYVDGFSGPWRSEAPDYSDTSFMIALNVLREAQQTIFEQTGKRRRIRCFFSESDRIAFEELSSAVAAHHLPESCFEVRTFHGKFEDAISEIRDYSNQSFPIVFIDPTGWTGYPLPKIAPLFRGRKCEVLINFMYDHINRFLTHPDPVVIASLNPILGGEGWEARLSPDLEKGQAVELLFRETLKSTVGFEHVVSTRIDKSTADRPHFFLAYGTKDSAGLKAFREIEFGALKEHARNRSAAKARSRSERTGERDLFADHEADVQEATIEQIVESQKQLASNALVAFLKERGPLRFDRLVGLLLEPFVLRETNVKDLCVGLAERGIIRNTWGARPRKPVEASLIELT